MMAIGSKKLRDFVKLAMILTMLKETSAFCATKFTKMILLRVLLNVKNAMAGSVSHVQHLHLSNSIIYLKLNMSAQSA